MLHGRSDLRSRVLGGALLSLDLYRDYFREHRYGLSNLTFGGWLWEWAKGIFLSLVFGAIAISVLYSVVRRLPSSCCFRHAFHAGPDRAGLQQSPSA